MIATGMAQLLIRKVEPELKRELERRAESNGRSLDAEICEIIRTALDEEDRKGEPQRTRRSPGRGSN